MPGIKPLGHGNRPLSSPDFSDAAKESNTGINQATGQRYTPAAGGSLPETPLGARTADIQPNVRPQLNRHGEVERHRESYQNSNARINALETELDLAGSLESIRHYLQNPAEAKKCSAFVILWVPDQGDTVSVIPPGKKMDDDHLAKELKQKLEIQLDTLDAKYTPKKCTNLQEQLAEAIDQKAFATQNLDRLNEPLPVIETPKRAVVLGGSGSISAATTSQPITPDSQTGQTESPPLPPTPVAPEPTPTTAPSGIPRGKFVLQFKNQQPTHHQSTEESEEEVPLPFQPNFDALPESVEQPLSPERKGDQTPSARGRIPYNPDHAIPRPRSGIIPDRPASTTSFGQPLLGVDGTASSSPTQVTYTRLGAGENSPYSDIFDTAEGFRLGSLASVNAGDPNLYVGGSGINGEFADKLASRGDVNRYAAFHWRMLQKCEQLPKGQVPYYFAAPDDLAQSPGLAASLVFKPKRGKNTSSVFIDVFKDSYPNKNPANKAMVYLVPPNGNNYKLPENFLKEVKAAASNMVMTLQRFNEQAITDGQAVIPTLRVCGFSSDRFRHHAVSEEQVGQHIEQGIKAAVDLINKSQNRPLTITNIEFATGGTNVFSTIETSEQLMSFDDDFVSPSQADLKALAPSQKPSRELPSADLTGLDLTTPGQSPSPVYGNDDLPSPPEAEQPQNNNKPFPPPPPAFRSRQGDSTDVRRTADKQNKPTFKTFKQGSRSNAYIDVAPRVREDGTSFFSDKDKPNGKPGEGGSEIFTNLVSHPNAAKTRLTESLKEACSQELANEFETDKARHFDSALEHTKTGSHKDVKKQVGKALLTRVLVNFHRKHIAGEADLIPDTAIPAIELGVMCNPDSANSNIPTTATFLRKKTISERGSQAIALAVNKNSSGSYLLSKIIEDTETILAMSSVTNEENFYSYEKCSTTGNSRKAAQNEFSQLLAEYIELMPNISLGTPKKICDALLDKSPALKELYYYQHPTPA